MPGQRQLQQLIDSATLSFDDAILLEMLSWRSVSTVCDHEWWSRLLGWEASDRLARLDGDHGDDLV